MVKKISLAIFVSLVLWASFVVFENPSPQNRVPISPAATSTSLSTSSHAAQAPRKSVETSDSSTTESPNITVVIASTSYPMYAPEGSNVIDAMRTLASENRLQYTSHQYSGLGEFIDSINGEENSNGYYWFLYVNGKSSQIGASETFPKPGDSIEWRYEKSY